jgi:hypothetical protein
MQQYAWTGKQLKAMSGAVAVLATGYAKDALFTDLLLTLRDPFVRAELIRDWSGEATQAFAAMQGQLRRQLLHSGGFCRKFCLGGRKGAGVRVWREA